MTIQQMLVGGNSFPPVYVGVNSAVTNSVSNISVDTPSTTQVGDLLLFFASSTNNGAHTWNMSPAVTEIQDSNAVPNLYFGYTTATAAGTSTYTLTASKTANLRIVTVVYRYSKYETYNYSAPGSPSSTAISLTPASTGSVIVGYAVANQGSITWSVTNSQFNPYTNSNTTPVSICFLKENITTTQSFTISGMSGSQPFQAILVGIGRT